MSQPEEQDSIDDQEPEPGHRFDHLLPPRESSTSKRIIIIAGVVFLVLAAGIGVYWFALKNKNSASPRQTTQTKAAEPSLSPEVAAQPQTFKSSKLDLEFTYRKDWTFKEDSDSGEIILSSPKVNYTRKQGSVSDGAFRVKIHKGLDDDAQAVLNEKSAVLPSETIGYAAPTTAQRYYTNVSFAGKDTFCNFIIVTGATQFTGGEIVGNSLVFDSESLIIAGGYNSRVNDGLLDFDLIPKDQFTKNEAYTQAIEIVKSLKIF